MPHPAPDNRWQVPFDGTFRVKRALTEHPLVDGEAVERLQRASTRMEKLQRKLYADDRYSLLLIFQAMDAAGKDGTIRAVMRGIDPQGCHVTAFKRPSAEELDHDFLWRVARSLPERGRIGIFNRSHYEEVLVVKVHPELLGAQHLPGKKKDIFDERFESIRDFERHLYRNGTVILKFWLNVSHATQGRRLMDRIDDPNVHWKFEAGDVAERGHWPAYMRAYETALNETSRPWAPWYAVPADDKPSMRAFVAETIADTLDALPLKWPQPGEAEVAEMSRLRTVIEND